MPVRLGYHVWMLAPNLVDRFQTAGLRCEVHDGIAVFTLARTGGNRFSHALLTTMREAFQTLKNLEPLRAVVLRGDGADFSFGADLTDPRMADAVAGSRQDRVALAALGQDTLDAWAQLPVPTIAAARGRIIGAGACFFCTADFAYAAPEATVLFPEVNRAMHLSWGVLPRLVGRFGPALTLRLALLGAPVACAELAPHVVTLSNPEEAGHTLAKTLAAKPPLAVRAIKRVVAQATERLQEAAADDAALFADTIGSGDFAEAMAAFFEKRPGRYTGR